MGRLRGNRALTAAVHGIRLGASYGFQMVSEGARREAVRRFCEAGEYSPSATTEACAMAEEMLDAELAELVHDRS